VIQQFGIVSRPVVSQSLSRPLAPQGVEPRDTVELGNQAPDAPVNLKQMLQFLGNPQADIARPVTETAVTRLPGLDKVWAQGFTGKGQTVAVIDSGIFPHPDIKDRVVGYLDLAQGKTKLGDTQGHGTHVAGIVAGSGKKSNGTIKGVAPEANLVGVRIASVEDAINGIDWVVANKDKFGIGVVNLSLGEVPKQKAQDDPWCKAVQRAIDAGLTVVVAAGNEGALGPRTIATPGISPNAITVGGVDDQGTSNPADDVIYQDSSLGPSIDGLQKPDVMAPAICVYSTLSPGSVRDDRSKPHVGSDYIAMVGTSMATPAVAGLVALLKQARPDLSPADLKSILTQSVYRGPNKLPIVQADAALQLAQKWSGAVAA
jgi:serine protease AprX